MNNTQVAQLFRNVAAAYTIQDEKKFRFQILAYQKAADIIENTSTEIKDLLKDNKLEQLPGIGPSIRSHIEELFKKGKVAHFEAVLKQVPPGMFALMEIPTFGPKKAYRLAKKFHLNTKGDVIENVLKLAKQGEIAKLEGFGEKSQEDIIRAISEFRLGKGKTTKMILPYASEIAEKMLEYLKKSKEVLRAEPLGSLRRMKSTIGDVDIAIATDKPQDVIDYFVSYPYKERVIEKGPATASLLISGGKQIDLMTVPPQMFGSLLQHFTGSKEHNIHLREYALKKGISLSEHGFKRKTSDGKIKIETFDTEEKLYNALGLVWIPPEIREDTGEIELAVKNSLPKLVELKNIKGDLHIHSNYPIEPSHDLGENSMNEMLNKAKQLDYEYLGFSEHNPSVSKHSKNAIYSILAKRKEKIEQIKKSNKSIQVINLLEVDILVNGDLAIDNKALSTLDACLVSIHSSFGMNKREMTQRILNGLSHPKAKILSHPTGKMFNVRPAYELDFDKIFDFCKKQNKALEINAWPSRLDLSDIIVRKAVEYGVKMIINTDSHAAIHMNNMKYGIGVARRGWAEKKDILNTLPYKEFLQWLES